MKIKCVEMVRRIRDEMAKEYEGKSPAEVVKLIRGRAKKSPLWKKYHKATPRKG